MIRKIATVIFGSLIFAILGFLWLQAPQTFRADFLSSTAAGLQQIGNRIMSIFNRQSANPTTAETSTRLPQIAGESKSKPNRNPSSNHNPGANPDTSSSSNPDLSANKNPNPNTNPSSSSSSNANPKSNPNPDPNRKISALPIPVFQIPEPPKSVTKTSTTPTKAVALHGKPVQFLKLTVSHVPLYETIIDLHDPETFISVGLPNNAFLANDKDQSSGDESFESLVKKAHASVMMNGTFFSKDDQKRVMGNMVSGGKFLKYSPWENAGTTFGLTKGNVPEMITARAEGVPNWGSHWFSLTCGPRLLRDGVEWIYPEKEGFADPHVLGIGPRCALGINFAKNKLILCTFVNGLSLSQEARLMKELGCWDAMNLDGGASRALAHNGAVIMAAGRPLTNVLIVYDTKNKAPQELKTSWSEFQQNGNRVANQANSVK